MSQTADVQAALEAARAAAEAGDAITAEARLREAAGLQERALGSLHPDLAETLNNLAIVSERLGRTAEAERCYRRAADIAAVALPASHPFVATSRDNLRAFCEAHGLPVESPQPTPAPRARPTNATPAPGPKPQPAATPLSRPEAPNRPAQLFGLLLIVVLIAVIIAMRSDPESSPPDDPAPAGAPPAAAAPPPVTPAPVPEPAPAAADAPPAPTLAAPQGAAPTGRGSASDAVVEARVCRSLSRSTAEWRCEAIGETAGSGRLYFYTRIRSRRDTSVSHRWYQGGRLRQEVDLELRANPSAGYRTFSLMTIPPDGAGPWRVELRSANGALLHEETFIAGGSDRRGSGGPSGTPPIAGSSYQIGLPAGRGSRSDATASSQSR